ncbi:hypothetical protein FRX31_022523 [Thalictrum thalictroides]|uniref:Uncharacterized protein n=1 Tax=Thalictrum thalictroides TaxID=46969 RepID=A0A7J6VS19_THATH|nr:hypothetical protein FRX31_022523 [Thalictrum thalictroides]
MGLEIPEEFWPITPIQTIRIPKTKTTIKGGEDDNGVKVLDLVEEIKNVSVGIEKVLEEEEECHTPTSEDQLLKTPLVCPPAPRKPQPLKRKSVVLNSQLFFHVPRDLNCVFVPLLVNSSKKIRAG